jgi:hypothetical protein
LKPSLIYGVFSILIPNFLISSLSNKFYSIALEFGQKKYNRMEKRESKDQIEETKKIAYSINNNICEDEQCNLQQKNHVF